MTERTGAVRRRTVLQRAAAGVGGAVVLAAADPAGEAAAAVCVETTTSAQTWYDACPLANEAFEVSEGTTGSQYGSCTADDGTDYAIVDWDLYLDDTWIAEEHLEFVKC